PRLAAVGRLVHAVAVDDVDADGRLSGPRVDDVGVRLGHRERTDRRRSEVPIRDVLPVGAAVGGFPHAPGHRAEVEDHGLGGMPADGHDAAAPGRTDAAPTKTLEPRWIHRLDLVLRKCRVRSSRGSRRDAVADDRPGPGGTAIVRNSCSRPAAAVDTFGPRGYS